MAQLQELRKKWAVASNSLDEVNRVEDTARPERLKTTEAEGALIRLLQSDDHLAAQVKVGVLGISTGSGLAILFKAVAG